MIYTTRNNHRTGQTHLTIHETAAGLAEQMELEHQPRCRVFVSEITRKEAEANFLPCQIAHALKGLANLKRAGWTV